MITNVLQKEKKIISELLTDMLETVKNLEFLNIPDDSISKEFKERWNLKLEKFLSNIEHYKENEYPIVVLGRWNSGKSTMINAILGEDILPSANREMTSILTKVSYSDEPNVIAQFHNGEHQIVSLSEIEEHISYRGSKYSNELKQIDIQLNNQLLKSGICILDTPGVGSINELNNTITFDIIPKADSILLTFSASDVGGDANLELVEQVFRLNYDNLRNVVLIITKCDTLNENELSEAIESLKELVRVTQEKLGVILEGHVQICMISSYMELKYRQYLNNKISKEQLLKDNKLRISNINEIELLHNNSKFDEFYKILDKSILSSGNKKNVTNNLFLMSHNILGQLVKDYEKTNGCLNMLNIKSQTEIKQLLQERVNIEKKIQDAGNIKIERFNQRIMELRYGSKYNIQKSREVINNICNELCKIIEGTSYRAVSKNNFEMLNNEVYSISIRLVTDWVKEIKEELDEELKKTVTQIEEIIEENNKEMDNIFENDDEVSVSIKDIRIKKDSSFANFMVSAASGVPIGAGLFAVGNVILPGIGGIIGGITGSLLGLAASMIRLSGSQKTKENLKEKLRDCLYEKMDEPQQVLNELCLKYTKSIKSLRIYLEMSLEQTIKEKELFTQNYEENQKKHEEYKRKLKNDINAIGNLMFKINRTFPSVIDNYL